MAQAYSLHDEARECGVIDYILGYDPFPIVSLKEIWRMLKENCRHSITDNATDAMSSAFDEIEVSIDEIVSDAAII